MIDTLAAMLEVRQTLKTCPKCGGNLTQKRAWRIECDDCSMRLTLTTLRERVYFWGFNIAVLAFCAGVGLLAVVFL